MRICWSNFQQLNNPQTCWVNRQIKPKRWTSPPSADAQHFSIEKNTISVQGERGPASERRCDAPTLRKEGDAATLRRCGRRVTLRRCDAVTLRREGDAATLRLCGRRVTLRRCDAAGAGRRCDAATLRRCDAAGGGRRCDAATLRGQGDAATLITVGLGVVYIRHVHLGAFLDCFSILLFAFLIARH